MMLFISFCPFFLTGCATAFTFGVHSPTVKTSSQSIYLDSAPPIAQKAYQCGPASLESVVRHWYGNADAVDKDLYKPGTKGILNFNLAQQAKRLGFWSQSAGESPEDLKRWLRQGIPPIVMLDAGVLWAHQYHFVVLKGFDDGMGIFYANTGLAQTQGIEYKEFEKRWKRAGRWSLAICPPEKVDWETDEAQSIELGILMENAGKSSQAEALYRSTLAKNPEEDAAKFNLANIYSQTNRLDEAEVLYRELLGKYPARSEIANNLASLYYAKTRYAEAIEVLEAAFKKGAPRSYDILDTAGMIYCKLGRTVEARDAFIEAVKKTPPEEAGSLQVIRDHMKACSS